MIRATLRREEQASPLKGERKSLNTSSSSPAMGERSQCLLHWEYLPLFQLRREVLTLTLPRGNVRVQIMLSSQTSKWSLQKRSFPPSKRELFVARSSRQLSHNPSAIAGIASKLIASPSRRGYFFGKLTKTSLHIWQSTGQLTINF